MAVIAAMVILAVGGAYAAIGVVFGVAFVLRGVGRIDESARHAPVAFRVLILPGAAALWPWLLVRWVRGRSEEERA